MADKPYHCVAWIHGSEVSGYLSCTRNEERVHSHLTRLRKQGRKNIGIVERSAKPRGVKAPPKLRKQPQGSLFPSDDSDTPQGSLFGVSKKTLVATKHNKYLTPGESFQVADRNGKFSVKTATARWLPYDDGGVWSQDYRQGGETLTAVWSSSGTWITEED